MNDAEIGSSGGRLDIKRALQVPTHASQFSRTFLRE